MTTKPSLQTRLNDAQVIKAEAEAEIARLMALPAGRDELVGAVTAIMVERANRARAAAAEALLPLANRVHLLRTRGSGLKTVLEPLLTAAKNRGNLAPPKNRARKLPGWSRVKGGRQPGAANP